jgi:acyl-CoA thioesterase
MKDVFNNCPYSKLLGMEVINVREGKSRMRMPFKRDLTHPYGIIHGGAIASLADSSVAMALLSLVKPSDRIMTIEFEINFFVPAGEKELTAEAKIIHKNSNTAVGVTEVVNEDDKLVAKVIATYGIGRGD